MKHAQDVAEIHATFKRANVLSVKVCIYVYFNVLLNGRSVSHSYQL